MFVRRENFRQFTQLYPVITLLLAVITILFIASYLPIVGHLIYSLGIGHNPAIEAGQLWRLVTPIFLHHGPMHFLFNAFALFIFGPALERILGRPKFIILYFAAGIAGNLATFFLGNDSTFYLGASGALYGLLGLYLYMVLYRKHLMDPASSQVIIVMLVIGLIYTLLWPNINLYAHLFGFLAGLALGPLLLRGNLSPFHPILITRRVQEATSDEIRFDPARWQKKRQWKHWLRYGLFGLFIVLILLGLWASL